MQIKQVCRPAMAETTAALPDNVHQRLTQQACCGVTAASRRQLNGTLG